MTGTTTLVLGGGWGGLTAAHQLRGLVGPEHRILVIERSATFSLGVSNLGLMTGERRSVDEIRRDMSGLKREGIEWVRGEVRRLDPVTRTVETDAGSFTGDYLVLALGAVLDPGSIPGFDDAAHNLYEPDDAVAINRELEEISSGRIVVLVAGAPFRCPAAPYEAAMLLDDWFTKRGIRELVEIDIHTPEGIPMAVAGRDVGKALCSFMDARGIGYHFNRQVTEVDGGSGTVRFGDGEAAYDLLVGIPPHRAPEALRAAGLTDSTGYVPVHPQTLRILFDVDTLEVGHPGVYAIGDVAAIRLMNQMLLPKAGVFAEGEAHVVAAAIAAEINDGKPPPGFDGHGFCYVDVGAGLAAYGTGDFYAYPAPRVRLEEPSEQGKRAKARYEDLLDTWFEA